jgi:hypothetical protein
MSSNRLGDIVAALPLHIADIAATGGSRAIPGLAGYRAAQGSIGAMAVAGGGGADTLDVKLQESDPPVYLDQINYYDGTDDGSEKLRDGAGSNLMFAIPFTPSANITIYSADLWLSRLGTIAAGESVYVAVQGDAAGDPDGTDINGAQQFGHSRRILGSSIPTSISQQRFFFEDGIDLTAATPYWLLLEGDITLSAANCVQCHYDTATSGCKYFDAAWAVMTNQNLWFRLQGLSFTDIVGATFAQITEGWLNAIDVAERIEVDLMNVKDAVRAYYTVSGGTWTIGNILNVGYPLVAPLA